MKTKQEAIEVLLRTLAENIDAALEMALGENRPVFTLLLWARNEADRANYISSSQDRQTIIKALRETADRLEKKLDRPPHWEPERH